MLKEFLKYLYSPENKNIKKNSYERKLLLVALNSYVFKSVYQVSLTLC